MTRENEGDIQNTRSDILCVKYKKTKDNITACAHNKDDNKQSTDNKNDCHNVSVILKELDLVEENNEGGK